MPRLTKKTVVGEIAVNVDEQTAQRLIADEGWTPTQDQPTKPATRRAPKRDQD